MASPASVFAFAGGAIAYKNAKPKHISKSHGVSQGISATSPADTMDTEDSTEDTASTMTGLTASEIIVSGAKGSAAGAHSGAASDMSETGAFDSKLAAKSGMQSAVRSLDTVSRGLMTASTASGLASTSLNIRKGKNTIIGKHDAGSAGRTGNSSHSSSGAAGHLATENTGGDGAAKADKSTTGHLANKYAHGMDFEGAGALGNGLAVNRINRWLTGTAEEIGMLSSKPGAKNKSFQTRMSEIAMLHVSKNDFRKN